MKKRLIVGFVLMSLATGCFEAATTATSTSSSDEDSSDGVGDCLTKSMGTGVPDWIAANFDCVQATVSGSNVYIKVNDIPVHDSIYFPEDDSRYTSSMPSGRSANHNEISEQSYTFAIPMNPTENAAKETQMDAIGVAIDGVVFYNNEAAPGDSLAAEIGTLDTANAHPTDTGSYHYHIEPVEITNDDDNLIGVLRDGYPVFGQRCPDPTYAGARPGDLDAHNGHKADLSSLGYSDFPTDSGGVDTYHYHLKDIGGLGEVVVTDEYYGNPGTMVHN